MAMAHLHGVPVMVYGWPIKSYMTSPPKTRHG